MRAHIIGVAGGTGSGKTTVVQALAQRLGPSQVAIIEHDSYYVDRSHLPFEARARSNYDHPDSLETSLLVRHLQELRQGREVQVPVYDFRAHVRDSRTRPVAPRPVILVEGILILVDPALREMMDLRIFVETDADIRFIRRLRRDMAERGRSLESVIEQYLATVKPMHLQFVEPSKRYADLIIPEGGENEVAIQVLVANIRSLMAGQSELPARMRV